MITYSRLDTLAAMCASVELPFKKLNPTNHPRHKSPKKRDRFRCFLNQSRYQRTSTTPVPIIAFLERVIAIARNQSTRIPALSKRVLDLIKERISGRNPTRKYP